MKKKVGNNYYIEPSFRQKSTGKIGKSQRALMRAKSILNSNSVDKEEVDDFIEEFKDQVMKYREIGLRNERNQNVHEKLEKVLGRLVEKSMELGKMGPRVSDTSSVSYVEGDAFNRFLESLNPPTTRRMRGGRRSTRTRRHR